MKRLIGVTILLLLMASCVKHEDPNEGLSIFKYNESAGILTLDPIYAKDLPHIWACNQLFSSLVAFDENMDVVPRVAHSWDMARSIPSICVKMSVFIRMRASPRAVWSMRRMCAIRSTAWSTRP